MKNCSLSGGWKRGYKEMICRGRYMRRMISRTVLGIVNGCIAFYKANSKQGQRFAELFTPDYFKNFSGRYDS